MNKIKYIIVTTDNKLYMTAIFDLNKNFSNIKHVACIFDKSALKSKMFNSKKMAKIAFDMFLNCKDCSINNPKYGQSGINKPEIKIMKISIKIEEIK